MSRHGRRLVKEYASIGDAAVQRACAELSNRSQKAVAMFTDFPYKVMDVLPMLFDDDAVCRIQNVAGLIEAPFSSRSYDLGVASLDIDFDNVIPPPTDTARHRDAVREEPLLSFIDSVRRIHFQYEEVKGLIRWLNRNATPGAVRYYFPAIHSLCDTTLVPTELTARHTTPKGIEQLLQVIRDASALVATSELMPSDAKRREPRPGQDLTVSFASQLGTACLPLTDYASYCF